MKLSSHPRCVSDLRYELSRCPVRSDNGSEKFPGNSEAAHEASVQTDSPASLHSGKPPSQCRGDVRPPARGLGGGEDGSLQQDSQPWTQYSDPHPREVNYQPPAMLSNV